MSDPKPTTAPAVTPKPWDAAWSRPMPEIQAHFRRAEKGDKSAMPEVRQLLDKPGIAAILGGDLARRAEEQLLDSMCKTNLVARESTLRVMADLRAELAGANPPPVERLMAERAVACWHHLHHLEHIVASKESMSIPLAQYYQKSIDRAHRRYLTALKTLAGVRKLGITVQLNIARRRVNVAGGAAVPADPK